MRMQGEFIDLPYRFTTRTPSQPRTLSGKVTALAVVFKPSFLERGVPSPTRRRPTRLAAEFIHLAVDAFSSLTDVGVELRGPSLDTVEALVLLEDAIVGDMKLPLPVPSNWEGAFLGDCIGESMLRNCLFPAVEVISVKVPMVISKVK